MTSPVLALRAAIRARLVADPALHALLGGAKVHDEPPRAAEPPYVTFTEASVRDWSTGSDRGHEQRLGLTVWSRQGGDRQALTIADRLAVLLDEADLAPAGHRLVNLRVTAQEVARPDRAGLRRVIVRLRAVTEQL